MCSELILNENQKIVNTLEIKLIETNTIKDMSNMFSECSCLKALPDIYKWNAKNVINIKDIFYKCESLESLPGIMKFKIKNDLTADIIFEECKSLKNFSGIGKEKKTIIYIINKNIKKIKLFGEVFVNNNKNNCHLLIDNEKKNYYLN